MCTLEHRLDSRAPQKDNSTDMTTVLQFKNLLNSVWTIRIDGVVTSHFYHIAREQGVLTSRASYKHYAYIGLGYLAQSIN